MSEANAEAVDSGALSIDQAIAAIIEPEAEPAGADTQPDNQELDAPSPGDEDASEPVEAAADEDAETQEPEAPAVDAPHWWTADKKAKFAELSPELQAIVAEEEANRERAVSRLKQEAAESRKQADAELAKMGDITSRLTQTLTQAEQVFAGKWPAEIDWAATARQYGAEQAYMLQVEWDRDTKLLGRLKAEREAAEGRAFQSFVQAEFAKLPEVDPELADPKQGAQRRQTVTEYLVKQGIPVDQVKHAGALEYALAHKAFKWDQHVAEQAKAKTALANPKPKPVPAARTVAPAAAAPQVSSRERAVQPIRNRFAQTRGIDDAAALILAMDTRQ